MTKKGPRDEPQGDIEVRIEKLKQKVQELTNGEMISDMAVDCPAEIEEQFWEHVLAFEGATESQPFEMLERSGISLPQPQELEDPALTAKLWEVIRGLALLGVYLEHTDHLSDRELYTHLWSDSLREPTALDPDNPNLAWHVDLIGSGSEEDILLYLKYYADEEDRKDWAQEWPDDPLPDPGKLPFDRDRHLPRSHPGEQFYTD